MVARALLTIVKFPVAVLLSLLWLLLALPLLILDELSFLDTGTEDQGERRRRRRDRSTDALDEARAGWLRYLPKVWRAFYGPRTP